MHTRWKKWKNTWVKCSPKCHFWVASSFQKSPQWAFKSSTLVKKLTNLWLLLKTSFKVCPIIDNLTHWVTLVILQLSGKMVWNFETIYNIYVHKLSMPCVRLMQASSMQNSYKTHEMEQTSLLSQYRQFWQTLKL